MSMLPVAITKTLPPPASDPPGADSAPVTVTSPAIASSRISPPSASWSRPAGMLSPAPAKPAAPPRAQQDGSRDQLGRHVDAALRAADRFERDVAARGDLERRTAHGGVARDARARQGAHTAL